MTQNEFHYSKQVQTAFLIFAVLFIVLGVTLPLGIYFLVRRSSAKLAFEKGGFRVVGLGLPSTWRYADLERIGTLSIAVQAPFGHSLNGGVVAVNLCARTKSGKNLKFMISRFEQHPELIARIVKESGLPLETVGMGAFGPSWPASVGGAGVSAAR